MTLPCMRVAEDRCNHSNQLKVAGYSSKLSNSNAGEPKKKKIKNPNNCIVANHHYLFLQFLEYPLLNQNGAVLATPLVFKVFQKMWHHLACVLQHTDAIPLDPNFVGM